MSKRKRAQDFAEKHGEMNVYLINDFTQVEYHKKDGTFLKWSEGVAEVFLGELNSAGEKIKCSMSLSKHGIWISGEERVDIDQIREALAFYDAIYNLSPLEKAREYIESLDDERKQTMWEGQDSVGYHSAEHSSDLFAFDPQIKEVRWRLRGGHLSVVINEDGSMIVPGGLDLTVPQLQELINFWTAIYGDREGV